MNYFISCNLLNNIRDLSLLQADEIQNEQEDNWTSQLDIEVCIINHHCNFGVHVYFIRNLSINNMRLKLGKNEETFKKHRQTVFQIVNRKK